jgi:hypothetical protein
MKTLHALTMVATLLALALPAMAHGSGRALEVELRSDDGRTLPIYPAASQAGSRRVYAEAFKGDHYRIVVRNRLNRRVGLVVAVDGRNIISGKKSWLRNDERMYVLEPYAVGEYAGWRSSDDRINRFYFTDVADSYAAAFGDESAMGVIAVAAYPEVVRDAEPQAVSRFMENDVSGAASIPPAAPAPASAAHHKAAKAAHKREMESAGTGYGREEYSPAITVAFEPEALPREKVFIKYEWRESLCRLGVISCRQPRPPKNRLWDEENGGYAPPPPRRG